MLTRLSLQPLQLRFLDSLRFMAVSLDVSTNKSSSNKLSENKLPSRQDFFNNLTNTKCSKSDYKHAQEVWPNFGCQTLKDYTELYLKTDVLLLADIFENFRDLRIEVHELGFLKFMS